MNDALTQETFPWEESLKELWKSSRFVSYFYQMARFVETDAIPTLALHDGERRLILLYNREFILGLPAGERIGLLVHEMMHVLMNHDHRASGYGDTYLVNLAQDMVVNSYLLNRKKTFFSRSGRQGRSPELNLPRGLPVVPESFRSETGTRDPSWEELYLWLTERPDEVKKGLPGVSIEDREQTSTDRLRESLSDPLGTGEKDETPFSPVRFEDQEGIAFEDRDGNTAPTGVHLFNPEASRTLKHSRKQQLLDMASRDGSLSDERVFHELTSLIQGPRKEPPGRWEPLIKSIIDHSSYRTDWTYSYSRFNRRYFAGGIYTPGRILHERRLLTVTVDVSGSMVSVPGRLERAFGIVESLLDRFTINLLCIDDTLFIPERGRDGFVKSGNMKRPCRYKKGDWRHLRTGTSGTTLFAPLFNEYMQGHREALLVLTDGQIYDMERLTPYEPTIWLVAGRETFHPPFGTTFYLESDRGGR
jgi:predicted metal-dependent peptidase